LLHNGGMGLRETICAGVLISASVTCTADATQSEPAPSLRVPVAPLGYVAPSPFYLTARLSSVSLDFIDKDHLLFTFRVPGLMQRIPEDPVEDEDQTIRAVVLELPSGKVLTKAEWRMHDRSRYLWWLGDGLFLVRQRSRLFVTDKTLQLRPFLNSETALESVQLSPDRRWIAIEAEGKKEERQSLASTVPSFGDARPESKPVQIFIVDAKSRAVTARAEALDAVDIPMVGDGHLLAIEGKHNSWIIRYDPFHGEARQLTEIESSCHPSEIAVSSNVALVIACPRSGNDHLVSAINLEGKVLWQQRWESRYIWATFQLSQNGSRFAYSSLQVSHPVGTLDPVDQESIERQLVGVFDTFTGKLRLVKNATPILSAGQNYALSSDGTRFAILREGAIEVYDLPPAEEDPGAERLPPKK
jgi:hypothetical protein